MSAGAASLPVPSTRSGRPVNRARLLDRLRGRLSAPALDRRLAAGENASADDAIGRRAAQLISRRGRDRIASGVERLRPKALRTGALSAAIPIDPRAFTIAEPALAQLAAALRSRGAVEPRGVALALLLLTDPGSPLYQPQHPDELYEAAREALFALGRNGIPDEHVHG